MAATSSKIESFGESVSQEAIEKIADLGDLISSGR